jgi:hypothetical protein
MQFKILIAKYAWKGMALLYFMRERYLTSISKKEYA